MKAYLQNLLSHDDVLYRSYAKHRQTHGRARALLGALGERAFGEGQGQEADAKRRVVFGSESALHKRISIPAAASLLANYDVISFDVFDTLLFRCVDDPVMLFHVVGAQLDVLDFARLRAHGERLARAHSHTSEVSLSDIYAQLSHWGIDAQKGMTCEWALECACCYANPYMAKLVALLHAQGKRLIAISDMYLSKAQISELLERCGYPAFEAVFVSGECGVSKAQGGLYDLVKETIDPTLHYVHIGDHPHSDHKMAVKRGFSVLPYANIHTLGAPRRAHEMSALQGSIYRALVNARLHGGCHRDSCAFELGYVYGAWLVIGYCQYLHAQRSLLHLDELWFLARDGEVVMKAYARLYPQEQASLHYVPSSRSAAGKLLAKQWQPDFLRRFLYHKVNQQLSLAQVFEAMEAGELLELLAKEEGIGKEAYLSTQNVERIKQFLLRHYDWLCARYAPKRQAAKQLLSPLFAGEGRVGVVDAGWAGSGAIALSALAKQWGFSKEIIGFLIGTNTLHNHEEADMSEGALAMGKLNSYVFSSAHNRALWRNHDHQKGHNVLIELLLASPAPSLKDFVFSNGQAQTSKKPLDAHAKQYAQIQEGILCFVEDYLRLVPACLRRKPLGSDDAYAPVCLLSNSVNQPYYQKLIAWMSDHHV